MTLANRTDSDRLDDLIEAVDKQTAAIRQAAGSAQEDAEKALKKADAIRSIVWDVRMWVMIFMAIFILNGCYREWNITAKFLTAAKNPSASSAAVGGFGKPTSR